MKKINLLLTMLLLAVFTYAQSNRDLKPFKTKQFNSVAIKHIQVETSGGYIRVKGGQRNGLIEMYVRPSNSKYAKRYSENEIREILNKYYDVEIAISGNTVIAKSKRKNNNWDNKTSLSVSFVVYSGIGVDTELKTSGGSIDLSDVSGTQLFTTSGGSLTVSNIVGKINGRTSGGSITANNLKNEIDLRTSGGSITAQRLTGSVKLKTSGGSLHLSDLSGHIDAHTSGGSITVGNADGTLTTSTSGGSVTLTNISGNADASTSGGSITASVSQVKEYIKLSTSAGGVHVKLPSLNNTKLNLRGSKVNIGQLNGFNGKVDKDEVNGMIGDGSKLIQIKASTGNVDVNI